MNYKIIYDNFINSRKTLSRIKNNDGQLESHHIVPRSFGGNNQKENLILLTPREHYFAHLMLYKMHSGKDKAKMAYALFKMCNNNQNQKRLITSKQYEYAKLQLVSYCSGENHPGFGKTCHTPEQRKKISERMSGSNNHAFGKPAWNRGKTGLYKMSDEAKKKHSERLKGHVVSDETRIKISAGNTGKPKSLEHRTKLSKANIGKKLSVETKRKMSLARKVLPICIELVCPHCNKLGKGSAMFRWHFDNCKSK